jgi:hypothetical protein
MVHVNQLKESKKALSLLVLAKSNVGKCTSANQKVTFGTEPKSLSLEGNYENANFSYSSPVRHCLLCGHYFNHHRACRYACLARELP